MPTINQVLERTSRARPDGIEDAVKAAWLLALDEKLLREVLERHEDAPDTSERPISWPEDGDRPLLVGAPDDELYDLYLYCRGDERNRDYNHYASSAALFNAALDSWCKRYHRTHPPIQTAKLTNLL